MRRVLHIIREEAQHEAAEHGVAEASSSLAAKHDLPNPQVRTALLSHCCFHSCATIICGSCSACAAVAPITVQAGPGLLAQVLRGGMKSAHSLSNLLDGIEDLREILNALDKDALEKEVFVRDQASEAAESHASTAKRKTKSVPQWSRKQNVIDAINELIEELDNIQQSITLQGVEHIHAKEVRSQQA